MTGATCGLGLITAECGQAEAPSSLPGGLARSSWGVGGSLARRRPRDIPQPRRTVEAANWPGLELVGSAGLGAPGAVVGDLAHVPLGGLGRGEEVGDAGRSPRARRNEARAGAAPGSRPRRGRPLGGRRRRARSWPPGRVRPAIRTRSGWRITSTLGSTSCLAASVSRGTTGASRPYRGPSRSRRGRSPLQGRLVEAAGGDSGRSASLGSPSAEPRSARGSGRRRLGFPRSASAPHSLSAVVVGPVPLGGLAALSGGAVADGEAVGEQDLVGRRRAGRRRGARRRRPSGSPAPAPRPRAAVSAGVGRSRAAGGSPLQSSRSSAEGPIDHDLHLGAALGLRAQRRRRASRGRARRGRRPRAGSAERSR